MRHRPWTAVIVVLTAVGVTPALGAATWQEQSSLVIPAGGIRVLRVENARGVVNVTRGSGSVLRVTALKVVRSNDAKWAREVSAATQVVTERRAAEYLVRVVYPQRQTVRVRFWDLFSDFELPRVEVRLALEVPDGMALTLKSTSGDLASTDVRGSQMLESTSGDVTVTGATSVRTVTTSGDVHVMATGAAQVRSVSGDVLVERVRGPLTASTTSGDVQVRDAADSLDLGTVSGNITVDAAPRGVRAQTTSGEIDVRHASGRVRLQSGSGDLAVVLAAPFQRAEVQAGSGGVTVKLDGALACALDLATSNGEIQVDATLDVEHVTHHKLTGSVRHGTAPVMIRTASGDISVSEGAR